MLSLLYLQRTHTHKASMEEREKVVLHTHTIIVPNTPKMAVYLLTVMKGPKFK